MYGAIAKPFKRTCDCNRSYFGFIERICDLRCKQQLSSKMLCHGPIRCAKLRLKGYVLLMKPC